MRWLRVCAILGMIGVVGCGSARTHSVTILRKASAPPGSDGTKEGPTGDVLLLWENIAFTRYTLPTLFGRDEILRQMGSSNLSGLIDFDIVPVLDAAGNTTDFSITLIETGIPPQLAAFRPSISEAANRVAERMRDQFLYARDIIGTPTTPESIIDVAGFGSGGVQSAREWARRLAASDLQESGVPVVRDRENIVARILGEFTAYANDLGEFDPEQNDWTEPGELFRLQHVRYVDRRGVPRMVTMSVAGVYEMIRNAADDLQGDDAAGSIDRLKDAISIANGRWGEGGNAFGPIDKALTAILADPTSIQIENATPDLSLDIGDPSSGVAWPDVNPIVKPYMKAQR